MSETATDAPSNYGRISLTTANGFKIIRAFILGPLAVHEDPLRSGSYTVTHVVTGMAVRKGNDEPGAYILADALQSLDWNFSDPQAMPEETKQGAGRIIRELGL